MTRNALIAAALFACACLPATASATETVAMSAKFTPYHLLGHTTVHFGWRIGTTTGAVPSPMTNVNVSLPAGMGLETTSLGLATCNTATLDAIGPVGCSPDAVMGFGSALGEVEVESQIIQEHAEITTLMAPTAGGHTVVLYYVNAGGPVNVQLIFPGLVLGASAPFGTRINTQVPITGTWPEGPDVSVVSLSAGIGPENLTYYRPGDKRIPFTPVGMQIPPKCPTGGFPFSSTISFMDGSRVTASTAIPCPKGSEGGRSARRHH
jgi:hypothetical protein